MTNQQPVPLLLPERLVGSVDLARAIRELQALSESSNQASLRQPLSPGKLVRSSATLEELAEINNIKLVNQAQRDQLLKQLAIFKKHAPQIHISLATEPSANFVRKLLIWMRANVHPTILLEVGLQPTLAAGCVVRTSNKMFDMSLRHRFKEKRHLLVNKISQSGEAKGVV